MFRPIKEAWSQAVPKAAPESSFASFAPSAAATTSLSDSSARSAPYGITSNIDETISVCTKDLYDNMRAVETEYVSRNNYNPDAAYLPFRRYLVDWMSDVGEQFNLHPSTIHTSVLYLDKIFREQDGRQPPPRGKWQLLATSCISVASKYEEAEEHCPPIPDLLEVTKLSQAGHNPLSFRDGELEVLEYLHWTLRAICPLHIIGYYLSKGVTFEADRWQNRALIEKIPRYVKKYAEFFCNLTLQDYRFQQYTPSHLAAAITMASRVALQLEPKWRPELTELTGYTEADIIDTFHHVWSYYEEQFPGHGNRSVSPKSIGDF